MTEGEVPPHDTVPVEPRRALPTDPEHTLDRIAELCGLKNKPRPASYAEIIVGVERLIEDRRRATQMITTITVISEALLTCGSKIAKEVDHFVRVAHIALADAGRKQP